MRAKTILQGLVLLATLVAVGHYLITNEHGIQTYLGLKKETLLEKQIVAKLEHEINELEQTLVAWETNPLEKEKLAREDLLMSYTNEFVYLLPASTNTKN